MTEPDDNLLVVSDLHISAGINPFDGKLSSNEDFLSDDSFAGFLRYHDASRKEGRPWRMIIAGDVFDFLQVTTPSSNNVEELTQRIKELETGKWRMKKLVHDPEIRRTNTIGYLRKAVKTLDKNGDTSHKLLKEQVERLILLAGSLEPYSVWGFEQLALESLILALKPEAILSPREQQYGLGTTWPEAVWKIDRIAEGHTTFFSSLAWFIDQGNSLVMMKGNHDIELYWDEVQNRLRDLVADAYINNGGGEIAQERVDKFRGNLENRFSFTSWIYYEPDLVYIEHGNQYEIADAFEDFLHPVLGDLGKYLRLPPGSFFTRYFFNRVEEVFTFADNIRPISRFVSWAFNNRFLKTLGLLLKNLKGIWLFTKAFINRGRRDVMHTRRLERFRKKRYIPKEEKQLIELINVDHHHAFVLKDTAKGELTLDRLNEIEAFALKERTGLVTKIREWARLLLPASLLIFTLLVLSLVFAGPAIWIAQLSEKISFYLDDYLTRLLVTGLIGLFVKAAVSPWLRKLTESEDYLLKVSREIKEILEKPGSNSATANVPYLVFGHTHDPSMVQLDEEGSWYVNTGSWLQTISEVESWSRLDRDFTFLEIIPGEAVRIPGLYRWNPNTFRPERIRIRSDESKD